MLTRVLALVSLVVLAALSGCSMARAPKLTVQSAELTERTPQGMVVTFTILADNSNPDALPLRDMTYTVVMNGKPVFSGTRSAEATVRRYGTQTFTVPAAIPIAEGAGLTGTEPFVLEGSLTYLVPGALAETLFDIHVLRPSTDFKGAGVVDLDTVKAPVNPDKMEKPSGPGPSRD